MQIYNIATLIISNRLRGKRKGTKFHDLRDTLQFLE